MRQTTQKYEKKSAQWQGMFFKFVERNKTVSYCDCFYDCQLKVTRFKRSTCVVSRATGSVSGSHLSTFDIISSKACEIAGDDIVTMDTREVARGNTIILSPNLRHQGSVAPYSTDNRGKLITVLESVSV